jgi:two-component system chemotaxis response regulator CheB
VTAAAAAAAGPPPIRLMIVDDSEVARAVLQRMLSAFADLEVVAVAGGGDEAVAALERTAVDVVLLDLEMPGGSGLEALPRLLGAGGGARVLIVSSFCDGSAEAALRALPPGVADLIAKPGPGGPRGRFSEDLAERLRALGGRRPRRAPAPSAPQPRAPAAAPAPLGCLALGASTGGVPALIALLRALPPRLGAPILVTQHLPASFVGFFAAQLEASSGRCVRVASEGAVPAADEILLAPGDAHLGLARRGGRAVVELGREPAPCGCLPAVDVMLGAAARIYGPALLGVVLSGMGRDGLEGSRETVERGGSVLVQDRGSAAVWGMPRSVAEAGLATDVLPPAEIAARIALRAGALSWK